MIYGERGLTMPELLAAATLAVIAGLLAVPSLDRLLGIVRTTTATRFLVVRLQGLRAKSIARARSHGLLFGRDGQGWYWREVRDGNGNGLRTAEVRDGRDPVLSGPHRLSDLIPYTQLGFPRRGPIPCLPPRTCRISDRERPVRLGNTGLLSYSELGKSSSGTLFVTDGRHRLMAIVLYGRTGRIRVWEFDPSSGRWKR